MGEGLLKGVCAVVQAARCCLSVLCLTMRPTHGPRRLPCGTRLGGRRQVSGPKACRTADRPKLAGRGCRRACVYVPLCV